jgi:hypothetical protein
VTDPRSTLVVIDAGRLSSQHLESETPDRPWESPSFHRRAIRKRKYTGAISEQMEPQRFHLLGHARPGAAGFTGHIHI